MEADAKPRPHDGPDAENLLRAALRERMRQLAEAYGLSVPGRDAFNLMSGVPAELRFLPMGDRDGAYDPEHGVILINSEMQPQRQRFTLAHEISHALLLADDDLLSDLHDAFEGEQLEEELEALCNLGAATLLMPGALVREVIERFGETGRALAELTRRADVSATSALYTLAEASETKVLYAVCAPVRSSAGNGPITVRASEGSRHFRYSLTEGTPVPEDHPLVLALASGLETRDQSYIPFRSGKKMKAAVVAFPQLRRVLVSFTVS
ncbi:ImmA/IrrE family metallo-endopeptidase [Deinococcus lacus]|uniref:ImmA/IrrE family metallo-endopeptidase n=1 Tax=Deinococcus lacus TaxID=392561 RepID=A0ABW1YEC1_9DEIO